MPLITPPNLNRCLSSSITDSKINKNMHECNLYKNATIPLTTINQPNCHISTNAVRQLKINKLMQTDIQPETWCVQMLNRYASELDQLLWLDYPQGNPTIIQRIKNSRHKVIYNTTRTLELTTESCFLFTTQMLIWPCNEWGPQKTYTMVSM